MFEKFYIHLGSAWEDCAKSSTDAQMDSSPFSYNFQLVISSDAFSLINYKKKLKINLTRRKKESEEKFKQLKVYFIM